MNYWLLIVVLISTILGLTGGWVAGKILIYRIIPKHRQHIAESIGRSASAAFSFAELEKKITDPDTIKKVMPLVEDHVDNFLRNKLKNKMPVIGMLIGDKTINLLKEVFLKEIEELFPHVLKKFAENLQTEINLENEVAKRINSIPLVQMEKMLLPALRFFSLAGAITGLITGLANIVLFHIMM